jgi:hypothetical protein
MVTSGGEPTGPLSVSYPGYERARRRSTCSREISGSTDAFVVLRVWWSGPAGECGAIAAEGEHGEGDEGSVRAVFERRTFHDHARGDARPHHLTALMRAW